MAYAQQIQRRLLCRAGFITARGIFPRAHFPRGRRASCPRESPRAGQGTWPRGAHVNRRLPSASRAEEGGAPAIQAAPRVARTLSPYGALTSLGSESSKRSSRLAFHCWMTPRSASRSAFLLAASAAILQHTESGPRISNRSVARARKAGPSGRDGPSPEAHRSRKEPRLAHYARNAVAHAAAIAAADGPPES